MTLRVTFDFSEVDAWEKDMISLANQYFPAAIIAGVTEGALFFEREAKLLAPVDTGRLRASIGHGPEGIWEEHFDPGRSYIVAVGTNVEYAPYMEFGFTMGTGHVAFVKGAGGFRYIHPFTFEGLFFMQKAANTTERILPLILERNIEVAIQAAGF